MSKHIGLSKKNLEYWAIDNMMAVYDLNKKTYNDRGISIVNTSNKYGDKYDGFYGTGIEGSICQVLDNISNNNNLTDIDYYTLISYMMLVLSRQQKQTNVLVKVALELAKLEKQAYDTAGIILNKKYDEINDIDRAHCYLFSNILDNSLFEDGGIIALTKTNNSLILGDNPVILTIDDGYYMPLFSDTALWYVPKSVSKYLPELSRDISNLNQCQIKNATRFIYAKNKDIIKKEIKIYEI